MGGASFPMTSSTPENLVLGSRYYGLIDYDELYSIAMGILSTEPLATPADLDAQVEAMM